MSSTPPPGLLPRYHDFESLWQLSTQVGDGGQGEIFSTYPKPNNKHYSPIYNNNSQFITKIINYISHSATLQRVLKCYLFVEKHKLLNIYGIYNDIKTNRLLIVMQRLSHELNVKYLIDNQTPNQINLRFSRPGYIYINNESSIKLFINQIAKQLDIIHNNNCIHFDLKPENIMYNQLENKWTIIDYDLMKYVSVSNNNNNGIYINHYRGTQSWTSPEMSTRASITKPSFINYKTDIFSFGLIILYIIDIGFQPYLLCAKDTKNVHCKQLISSQKWRRDKVYFDKLLRNGNGNQYLQNYLFQLKADYIISHKLYILLQNMLLFDVNKRFNTKQILNYLSSC